jgi:transcription elongation factor GreA
VSEQGREDLVAELEELRTNVRPAVIARVKAARELGDLKENADYEYARKEQSFMEGRIQTLEALIKMAVVVDPSAPTESIGLGSTVVVEVDGEEETYEVVGSLEADPAKGRISNVSPVGKALYGRRAGEEVTASSPGGSVIYRIKEIR